MAGKVKAAQDGKGGRKTLTAPAFRSIIQDLSARKADASEHQGEFASATKGYCDDHGLDKKALTLTRQLSELPETKRAETIRCAVDYWEKMGWFSQLDAFDDLGKKLREIGAAAADRQPAKVGENPDADPGNVTTLLQ